MIIQTILQGGPCANARLTEFTNYSIHLQLKKGNLLEIIKVYRELHSTSTVTVGMDEARRAVEEIKGRPGI